MGCLPSLQFPAALCFFGTMQTGSEESWYCWDREPANISTYRAARLKLRGMAYTCAPRECQGCPTMGRGKAGEGAVSGVIGLGEGFLAEHQEKAFS